MKKIHGSRKNRGNRPHHHKASSGSVARKAIQALEKIKIVEKDATRCVFIMRLEFDIFCCSGRQITQFGQQELDRIATQIAQ
jgi:small subunit ribosomal protein S19e